MIASVKGESKPIILGRLLPKSGKIHENQYVYDVGGYICTLKATAYKDPPKVLVKCETERKDE